MDEFTIYIHPYIHPKTKSEASPASLGWEALRGNKCGGERTKDLESSPKHRSQFRGLGILEPAHLEHRASEMHIPSPRLNLA